MADEDDVVVAQILGTAVPGIVAGLYLAADMKKVEAGRRGDPNLHAQLYTRVGFFQLCYDPGRGGSWRRESHG